MILKKHTCNVSVSSSSRSLISFFHLEKVKNSTTIGRPITAMDLQTASWSAACFCSPPNSPEQTPSPPKKKESDPSFIWRFFVVARSENVAFYRSGSKKKNAARLPTGIRLCTNSCFSGTQLTLLGIFKGFPLLPSAPVDRPEKTNEKSQVSDDYWL